MGKKRKGEIKDSVFGSRAETPLPQQSEQVNKQPSAPVPKRKDERLTVYIKPSIYQRLDYIQLELKQITGRKGYAISKSTIVESALIELLNEYDRSPENSKLVEYVMNHK